MNRVDHGAPGAFAGSFKQVEPLDNSPDVDRDLVGWKNYGYENGNFVRPTLLEGVNPAGEIATTEIFGPVLGLMHVDTVDDAIGLVNSGRYGNMACVFTRDGGAARRFRYEAQAGNIGINIGVAAPMAFFPFSGWRESFFGTLHGQGRHAVEFFTQTKVVVERWALGDSVRWV